MLSVAFCAGRRRIKMRRSERLDNNGPVLVQLVLTMTTVAVPSLAESIDQAAAAVESQVIAWRRDLHQHPELGNREFRTAGIVADHLRALGLDEVRTGVAHTGVVGLLKGALPGPVVALRADMDGRSGAVRGAGSPGRGRVRSCVLPCV